MRIPIENYKSERKRLTSAFSTASPVVAAFYEAGEPIDILIVNNVHKAILLSSNIIPTMATKTANGVTLFDTKKGKNPIVYATHEFEGRYQNPEHYRKRKIPATGVLLLEKDINVQQIRFDE